MANKSIADTFAREEEEERAKRDKSIKLTLNESLLSSHDLSKNSTL